MLVFDYINFQLAKYSRKNSFRSKCWFRGVGTSLEYPRAMEGGSEPVVGHFSSDGLFLMPVGLDAC